MGLRARRRFPRWQRFPHRPLPYWWCGWFNKSTRLTSAEIDYLLLACMKRIRWPKRRQRIQRARRKAVRIDRDEVPCLNYWRCR